jgi:aminopeptidase-like protein
MIPLLGSNGPLANEPFMRETEPIRISSHKDDFTEVRLSTPQNGVDSAAAGQAMYSLIEELFPICRSITGDGVRKTLRILQDRVPIEIREVPTGTQVFDWTVPKEWNIRDAYIKDASGNRIVDFHRCNLHVVNYSVPVLTRLPLEQLREHLFALPEKPDWIPYRTSYYKEEWGFCLSQRQLDTMEDGAYEVCIDSTLKNGHLTYGELLLPGDSKDEILLSCHICHPSLANDNLSGIGVAVALAQALDRMARRYTYRFLFIPGTIGAITWLALNEPTARRVRHGLVLAGVGDAAHLVYKKSRQGDAEIDRAVQHVLRHCESGARVLDFSPYGYDERQYCSPGFDLPVGRLSRSLHGEFPEYHTSADNLSFVRPESLAGSLAVCLNIFSVLENNCNYLNLSPKCEPQLGRRGLYRAIGGIADSGKREMAMLWTLNLSDGRHSLLDIVERSGLSFGSICEAAGLLSARGLLQKLDSPDQLPSNSPVLEGL